MTGPVAIGEMPIRQRLPYNSPAVSVEASGVEARKNAPRRFDGDHMLLESTHAARRCAGEGPDCSQHGGHDRNCDQHLENRETGIFVTNFRTWLSTQFRFLRSASSRVSRNGCLAETV